MRKMNILIGLYVILAVMQVMNTSMACGSSMVAAASAQLLTSSVNPLPNINIQLSSESLESDVVRGLGVATMTGFQTSAQAGDDCVVATALGNLITIESVKFVDEKGQLVPFSPFVFDRELSKTFGRSYQAFVATAQQDIPDTVSALVIEYTSRSPKLTQPMLADVFATGRVATAQSNGRGGTEGHAAIVNPLATVLCLGPADPVTELSTCPPPILLFP